MNSDEFSVIKNWVENGISDSFIESHYCNTRSDFNGRLLSYENIFAKKLNEDCLYLTTSSIGEVGNNCFDHNLGYWIDIPGCLFLREENFCIIADRAPENRGNGLKFTKKNILKCGIFLYCLSDGEQIQFGNSSSEECKLLFQPQMNCKGTFTLFSW